LKKVYLALGTNLGDRAKNLLDAIARLETPALHVLRASSIYETEPRDVLDQPWFLNQVIQAETSLFPRQLLSFIQKIEREMGRKRGQPKGPRLIDIDLLLYGSAIITTPLLEVPHPRMSERRFVLEPLAELAPDLRHPESARTVRELLSRVASQSVRKYE
jgi:2-amino-4-hydroxy-6-hydroxymethyldihydropteridine diphosphokinase